MPKSKRNKQIELAKTKKRGLEWKKRLFDEIRSSVDSYSNVFVFSVNDMRNSKMKTVRKQWNHSRFFIGKNKIMAMALGRFAEEEYKPNLHKIGQRIKGQRGLLFSNKSTEEVLSWFRSYTEGDYARSGNSATDDVKLDAGPLPHFPHSIEPYLRQLGLPTSLVKGVIHLVKDHEVCKAGDILTPETAKIIKLLGYEMAEFHFTIICMWSQDGSFMQFTEDVDKDGAKENIKKKKKKSSQTVIAVETVSPPNMEVEDSEPEIVEILSDMPKATIKEVESNKTPAKTLISPNISTPEDKSLWSQDGSLMQFTEDVDKDGTQVSIKKKMKKSSETVIATEIVSPPNMEVEDSEPKIVEMLSNMQKATIKEVESNKTPAKILISTNTSTPKDKSVDLKENNQTLDECPILVEKEEAGCFKNTPKIGKKKKVEKASKKVSLNEQNEINVNEGGEESDTRPSRSRKRKINVSKIASMQDSLQMTPDIANSSQDSPVFRELRNRSVKVSRKKK